MATRRNLKSFFSTQRHVNLIYFVDAAKTKTIRVSLRTASIVMMASAFVVIWAFFAGVLLLRMQAKQSDLRAELSTSRSVIFEYQTLHDGVFEQAYPELNERRYSGKPASKPTGAEVGTGGVTGVITDTPEKAKVIVREDHKSPVSLSNPSIVPRDGGFELFFDLRNREATLKAEGYIWAVAGLEKLGGERLNVTIPKTMTLSTTGEPLNTDQGQRFGIRRYSRRSFVFALPPHFEGRVLTVDIAFAGNGDNYRSSYTIPVNMRFSHLASSQALSAKKPVITKPVTTPVTTPIAAPTAIIKPAVVPSAPEASEASKASKASEEEG